MQALHIQRKYRVLQNQVHGYVLQSGPAQSIAQCIAA